MDNVVEAYGGSSFPPTYPTYDPNVLYPLENGWFMDGVPNPASSVPTSFMDNYSLDVQATALPATAPGTFVPETAGPSIFSAIGDVLGNVIRTVGQQVPGMITGQPTAPVMTTTTAPRSTLPFGLSPTMLLLVGGGVLLYLTMGRKRGGYRRNPRRRRARYMTYRIRNRRGRFVRRRGLRLI